MCLRCIRCKHCLMQLIIFTLNWTLEVHYRFERQVAVENSNAAKGWDEGRGTTTNSRTITKIISNTWEWKRPSVSHIPACLIWFPFTNSCSMFMLLLWLSHTGVSLLGTVSIDWLCFSNGSFAIDLSNFGLSFIQLFTWIIILNVEFDDILILN